jgi:hypothetical protein
MFPAPVRGTKYVLRPCFCWPESVSVLQRISRAFGDTDGEYERFSPLLQTFFAPPLVDLHVLETSKFRSLCRFWLTLNYGVVFWVMTPCRLVYMCPDDNSIRFNGCGCTSIFILLDPLRRQQGMRVWVPAAKEVFLFSSGRSYLSATTQLLMQGVPGTLLGSKAARAWSCVLTSIVVFPKHFPMEELHKSFLYP